MRIGRYEILEEIGRGGMARVHLARQSDLDRLVAIKELGLMLREDADAVSRFLRESRLAGALNHPNIVTVLEFFDHDGVQYIAMEYVPRGSLRPWIGRLSIPQVGGVLEGMLAGLAHAHAAGVIHRDLKPENLMVTEDGRIKITDFGIAKALADRSIATFKTATGAALGTPSYMSPEQALATEVGAWTDLYATGVIAYEMLSGRRPFVANEPMAILLAHCSHEPPPLSEVAPDVPEPLATWTHELLAKEAADRPQSAREAWDELEERLIVVVGPRWRREARIEGDPDAPVTPSRPVTPAKFPAEIVPPTRPIATPEPAAAAAAPAATPPAGRRSRPRTGLLIGGGLIAVVAVALALALGGGGGDGGSGDTSASATAPPKAATEPVAFGDFVSAPEPLGDDWIRAIHIWTYSEGYDSPTYESALRTAKADGATHVVVHTLSNPVSKNAAELKASPGTPPPAATDTALDLIAANGLKAIIQPVIEIKDSYSGTYSPDDPEAFLDGYSEQVLALAEMAGEHGADIFVIGSLLSKLDGEEYTTFWTDLADEVRTRCDCRVSYIADDLEKAADIGFWPAVDLIGVNRYVPLTTEPTLDPEVIARGWDSEKQQLQALADQHDKPIWLGELGYTSRADQSSTTPFTAKGKPSEDAQAAMFEAAFRAFEGEPWFAGIGWFELNGDGTPAQPTDYLFEGKLAEKVLRGWHTAL